MIVAVIDYGSGNLRSAAKALERAAREGGSGASVEVTADPGRVAQADRIVLPGVGAFADCKRGLAAVSGMIDALTSAVFERARPFLGICVGMQLMADSGHEHVVTEGLGWIGGRVEPIRPRPIAPGDAALKVPHMGWNELEIAELEGGRPHALLDGIATGAHAYFVHSYQLVCQNAADCVATVSYGGAITAAVGRANLFGTQFHPEKSQATGLRLLANFLKWTP